jgi:uncharacterized protein YggE
MRIRPVLIVPVTAAAALAISLAGCGSPSAGRTLATTPSQATGASGPLAPAGSGGAAVLIAGTTGAGPGSSGAAAITTNGTGTVSGAPDTMTIAINVSTSDAHASAALGHNNTVATAVQQALQRDGVAVKDIQTTGLSLQQTYPPSPAGYQVDDQVTATLRDLSRAGSAIDDAVAAAGDAGRLNGVSFSMSGTSPLLAAARNQAVAAARAEAQQLAAAAGEHLAGLVSLTDQPQPSETGPMSFAAAGAAVPSSAPVPVKPGTQQLSVVVTAVWAVAA